MEFQLQFNKDGTVKVRRQAKKDGTRGSQVIVTPKTKADLEKAFDDLGNPPTAS